MPTQISWITNPYVLAGLSGAVLGLSAPGFGHWYLCWMGLVPFFLLVFSSKNALFALLRGLTVGIAYNLVALEWFLHLNPPWWVGLEDPLARQGLSTGMWLVAGLVNGLVYALVAVVLHLLVSTIARLKLGQKAKATLLILLIAFVFSMMEHTVSYIPDLLLLPLSLLEYSQFRQPAMLQVCAIAGGGGLCALISAVNVAITLSLKSRFGSRLPQRLQVSLDFSDCPAPTSKCSIIYFGIAALIVASNFGYGCFKLFELQESNSASANPITVTVVQPGSAQECDRIRRGLSTQEVYARIASLLEQCPPGLVVWPETALFDLDQNQIDSLKSLSKRLHLNMIVGFLERGDSGKMFNSVLAISENGTVNNQIYRKRCLIPFGEFEPLFLRMLPAGVKKSMSLPQIPKFTPGSESLAIRIDDTRTISPIVCGENMDAFVCAQSVIAGGNIIVDLSNLEWFKHSNASEFTEAVCAVRAVENQRWLVYASDSGPSFVIDSSGKTVAFAGWGEVRLLTAPAQYRFEVTPFAHWVAFLKFLR